MTTTDDHRLVIREAFESWERGDDRPFFSLVHDDVQWTVIGSTDISGSFGNRREFLAGAAGKLTGRFATPLSAKLVDVSADGDKVFVQWEGSATTAAGTRYEQVYCWVLTMADGKIVKVVAYLDTELVARVLAE